MYLTCMDLILFFFTLDYIRERERERDSVSVSVCVCVCVCNVVLVHKLKFNFLHLEIDFTFMGPCIVNVCKHNQQDATLHNDIYYYKCSAGFRRFLRPSSGAQNCIHSIGFLSSFYCFLRLA